MDGWIDVYMNEWKYKKYHKMLSIALHPNRMITIML